MYCKVLEELHLDFVTSSSTAGNDKRVFTSDVLADEITKSACFCFWNFVIFENSSEVNITLRGAKKKKIIFILTQYQN